MIVSLYINPSNLCFNSAQSNSIHVEIKLKYRDPYLIVCGDFNQWRIDDSMANFADISEVKVGNTRGNRSIDKLLEKNYQFWDVVTTGDRRY